MYTDVHESNKEKKMIQSNRIEFTDSKLNMLGNAQKLYTNKEPFRANGKTYRLKLRVSANAKTFCLWHEGKRISLGQLSKEYGVANATLEAMNLISGDTTPLPRKERKIFEDLAHKAFDDKEKKGRKFVDVERRRFRQIPKAIVELPIDKITREMVMDWQEDFLATKKASYWNKIIEVPANIWNISAKGRAFSLLENRKNPFSDLKEETKRTEYPVPSFDQLIDIWKTFTNYDHPLVPLMVKLKILTGMHFTEIVNIKEGDIQDGWLTIDHKIGVKHKIWLHPVTRKLVIKLLELSDMAIPTRYLFTFDGFNPINLKTFNVHWNKGLKSANLDFRFDRLRDSLVTEMKESGYESKYITGHCYKENVQAKYYTDWTSEKMLGIFKEANAYWQTKVFECVKSEWF